MSASASYLCLWPFSTCDESAKIGRAKGNRSKWNIHSLLCPHFPHPGPYSRPFAFHSAKNRIRCIYGSTTDSLGLALRQPLVISHKHFTISSIRIVQQIAIRAKSTVVYEWHTIRLRYVFLFSPVLFIYARLRIYLTAGMCNVWNLNKITR